MLNSLLSSCLIQLFFTSVVAVPDNSIWGTLTPPNRLNSQTQALTTSLCQLYTQTSQGKSKIYGICLAAICSMILGFWYLQRGKSGKGTSEPSIHNGMTNGSAVTIRKSVDINSKSPCLSYLQSLTDGQFKYRGGNRSPIA